MTKTPCVLFLDDESSILNSLQRLFQSEPFGILTVADHQAAFAALETEEIKVVVSDHRMPEMAGTEFLKEVRERSPATVRILFTGYADFSAAEEAINVAGVYRFISKPWDNNELIAVIRQAIAQYDADKAREAELRNLRKRVQELEGRLKERSG